MKESRKVGGLQGKPIDGSQKNRAQPTSSGRENRQELLEEAEAHWGVGVVPSERPARWSRRLSGGRSLGLGFGGVGWVGGVGGGGGCILKGACFFRRGARGGGGNRGSWFGRSEVVLLRVPRFPGVGFLKSCCAAPEVANYMNYLGGSYPFGVPLSKRKPQGKAKTQDILGVPSKMAHPYTSLQGDSLLEALVCFVFRFLFFSGH